MFQFFIGLISGIYIGTNYECKPVIDRIGFYFKTYLPEKKEKNNFFWDNFLKKKD
tara:strand:- start:604 stop:768 length:165 start_codon:yes stop_codon:yes gene_type:complete